MATKVGEMFIDLAVDAASGNLSVKQLVGVLGELDVVSVASVGVMGKVADTLWGMAKAATGVAVEMSVLKDITGVDTKLAQQWEKAGERINIQSGSIVRSILSVNTMMGAIASHKQAPPQELTGWLNVSPQKGVDAQGRPVMKSYFDLVKDIGASKKYWGYQPQVQQQLLGGIFGSGSNDVFRILNEMRAGKWKPELISGLDNKQVKSLTAVQRETTEIGQQLTDIFQKFLIGGDAFLAVLDSISKKLKELDDWLKTKQASADLKAVGSAGAAIINQDGNPYKLGTSYGKFLGERFLPGYASSPDVKPPLLRVDDLRGVLDINVKGQSGESLGRKEVFLMRGVKNVDVEHLTINVGNGGDGQ